MGRTSHRPSLVVQRDDAAVAFAAATRVASTAELLAMGELLVRARLLLARWQLRYGNLIPAQRHLEAVFNLIGAGRVRRLDPEDHGLALEAMVAVFAQLGQVHQAATYQSRLEWLASQRDAPALAALVSLGRTHLSLAAGQAAEARAEAEAAYAAALGHDLRAQAARLALVAAEAAFEVGELETVQAYSQQLTRLSTGDSYAARRGAELASFAGVVTQTGGESLEALKGLHAALGRAQRVALPRDFLHTHVLLFRALKHLGSMSDAEHHRKEAARYAQQCALSVSTIKRLIA